MVVFLDISKLCYLDDYLAVKSFCMELQSNYFYFTEREWTSCEAHQACAQWYWYVGENHRPTNDTITTSIDAYKIGITDSVDEDIIISRTSTNIPEFGVITNTYTSDISSIGGDVGTNRFFHCIKDIIVQPSSGDESRVFPDIPPKTGGRG